MAIDLSEYQEPTDNQKGPSLDLSSYRESATPPVEDAEETSFWETIKSSFKAGADEFGARQDTKKVLGYLETIKTYQKFLDNPETSTLSPEISEQTIKHAKLALQKSMQSLGTNMEQISQAPMSEVSQRMMTAKTFNEAWDVFKTDPLKIVAEVGARSAPSSLLSAVGGIAGGAVAGPVGFAAGMGLMSGSTEFDAGIMQSLQEAGADLNDIKSIQKITDDPELMSEIKERSLKKASIVGAFDAASGGLASKTLAPQVLKNVVAKQLFNLPTQAAAQAGLGAGGEFFGEYAATGEIKPGEILAEAVGELVTAPVDVVSAGRSVRAENQQKLIETAEKIGVTETTDDAVQTAANIIEAEILDHEGKEQAAAAAREREITVQEPLPFDKPVAQEVAPVAQEAPIVEPLTQEQEDENIQEQAARRFEQERQATEKAAATKEARIKEEVDIAEAVRMRTAEKERVAEQRKPQEALISDLVLSKDLPQFKAGADKAGIVEPLGGKFERAGVGPIQVWVRNDGTQEVITGRHRLDLAKRSGETTIPAQYHYERDGFDVKQARALDATLNIREGQGQVKDYVQFIKDTNMTEEQAESEGILARATGKQAFAVATSGSDLLVDAHGEGIISDGAAMRIAQAAPNNEALQTVGIKAIEQGKSITVAENMVKAVATLPPTQQQEGDLFGFDTTATTQAETLAKKAVAKQAEIQRTLSAIKGAVKDPKRAAAEGVDVKDPVAVKQRITELTAEKQKWGQWHTDPSLVAELRGEIEPDLFEGDAVAETEAEKALAVEAEPLPERTVESTPVAKETVQSFDSAVDMVSWLETSAKEPVFREIATTIKNLISPSTKINVMGSGEDATSITRGQFSYESDTKGVVSENEIKIYTEGMDEETMTHELIHAATAFSIRDPQNPQQKTAIGDITNVQREVNSLLHNVHAFPDITGRERAAAAVVADDINEFVTNSMTNPDYQSMLKKLKTEKVNISMFTKFGNAVKKLLGLERIPDTIFARAVDASSSLIESIEQAPLDPEGSVTLKSQESLSNSRYKAYAASVPEGQTASPEGFKTFMGEMRSSFDAVTKSLPEDTITGDKDFTQYIQSQTGSPVPLNEIKLTRKLVGKDGKVKVAQVNADVVLRQTRKRRDMSLKLLGCINGS